MVKLSVTLLLPVLIGVASIIIYQYNTKYSSTDNTVFDSQNSYDSLRKMSTHSHSHSEKEQRVLLPTNVKPHSYHIHLTPDLTNFTFEGKETVDVVVNHATNTVVIHALDMKVHTASFTAENGHVLHSNNITFDQSLETVTFHFPSELPTGKGKLDITFQGNLNNVMMGFYRSKYTVNGEEKWMATTQMEPTGARRAFPAWDEPALKAVFNIALTIPSQLQALSNMDPISEKVEGQHKIVHFAPSPVMSTYLVAFCVGEFDYSESHTKEGVRVRVYTPKGKVELGRFSLDVATRTLSYFTDYFGIPYPLPKLDMIAIADFAAGAMENWGLVTYRETALLIDEKNSALQSKKRVAYVVAHELAHQWFGNLVTMEWWKELWLNEGFATFVGQQAVDHLFPDWDMWTQFVTDYVNRAQSLDGLENSHPIEVEVQSSAQIEEIFDGISYSKGASVIRMISNQIGEANMRKGLNIYLNRFKYRNAVTEDLWNALGEASGFDVKSFMNNYTKVTGYPLISIEPADNECQFRVSQQRFFSSGKADTSNQTWWVSLQVKGDNSAEVKKYDLKTKSETLTFDVKGANWFKVNYGQYGFYRVKYSADLTKKLSQALSHNIKAFNSADRIGLENDAFALAKAGFSTTSAFLELASGYQNEEDYSVWADLLGNLGTIASVWSIEPQVSEKLNAFTRHLLTPITHKLGWEPKATDSDLAKMLRPLILRQMAASGDQATIQECHKRFYNQVNNNVSIPPDFRGFIYESVVKFGGDKEYEDMLQIFKTADLHEERLRALRAAASTRQPHLQQKVLEYVLSDNVRAQDIFYGFYPFAGYAQGREIAWKFMRDHFAEIKTRVGGSAMILDHVIGDPLHDFASEQVAHEIEEFFKANPAPSAERTIKQTIESINAHAKWIKNHREDVINWLSHNVK